jgi:undecaprenyl-diphosphatase
VSSPEAKGPARLRLAEAIGLGLLHGPAELVPISSSGHLTVVPYLARWEYADLDGELRKAFEVALHAGTALALVVGLRAEVREWLTEARPRLAGLIIGSLLPPVPLGFLLEEPIERRLGTPGSIAVGLILGGGLLAWADTSPQERDHTEAGFGDALWLGVAQACALMPGVSRNGATLTAARLLRFKRIDANVLSWQVALPVIGGATALPEGATVPFLAGATAAFGSTLAATWAVDHVERDHSLAPFAVYRIGLGAAVLRRVWRQRTPRRAAR